MIGSSGLKILPVDNLDEAARSVHIQACLKVLGAMTSISGCPANFQRLLPSPEMLILT